MDEERAFQARHDPSEVRVATDPVVRLMKARIDVLDNRIAQLWAVGRVPRVCLYALPIGGQEPTHSREKARQFALQKGWQTGMGQAVTDRHGATDPQTRPGWSFVCQQIRSGFADGVVAVTHSVISPNLDEYEVQLQLVEAHLGFVALVTSETTVGNR
ncbi:hypothetical protein [Streptomyces sp. ISL-100]|uniref:hypothetical protein n=1 Tax=Streptomyces sp. ISL-100 TaxID=2819173 RepID=UPI00203550F7|nr:hypothetical protein [Streptomyces sp. ISL-100]